MENEEKTLADKLKELRNTKFPGEGLRSAAEKIGINFVHLNRIERGLRPSIETIEKLAKIYDASEEDKIELFTLANSTHLHPDIVAYFKNPIKAKAFFRKVKKDE